MSGHSKWAQIKRQKGATDAKKGAAFTKLASAITMAAREGGKDPDLNFRLRLAIDRARGANVPKENIERAILRGTGEGDEGSVENVTYEGFGPDGVAVIVEALTDNRNRTLAEVRRVLTERGGGLGSASSVRWMFERRGRLRAVPGPDRSATELAAIDAGALDVSEVEGLLTVDASPNDLQKIRDALLHAGATVESGEVVLVPKTRVAPESEASRSKVLTLLDALEKLQDVTGVATNADV